MGDKAVSDTTDASFQKDVLDSEVPVLVDFWATWCAPCKAIAPIVEGLAVEKGEKLKVVKLDIQTNMKTAQAYAVTNIPTLIVFKGGKPVAKQVGTGGGANAIKRLVEPHLS